MMKKFKIVMEGINEFNDIIMEKNLTKEQAIRLKQNYEQNDYRHYFKIIEEREVMYDEKI